MKSNNNNEINTHFLFERVNYKFLLIGLGVIVLGFLLMAGGGSDDPNVFNPEIFNFRRIRLAPMVVLAGFGIVFYSIVKNPSTITTEVPRGSETKDNSQPTKTK
jgi:hypothetical protein